MKLLFNVLTAVAAVFPAIAAENGDTVFVDFGELDQSPPVFYNRQRTMPAIMSPQVNTSMAVGEIPFSESVTPSGGKIYNVPVAVSEESRLRPEVSLLYNSQGAEGAAGYGWSISGVSAISVVNMTLHYDGVASSPDLSDPDGCAFALDGVRLLEREDAADGFAFETAEGFVRARKVKSGGALTRFDVRYPDGRTAVFGFSDSYETSHIYPVTEITDPDGSKMFYDYIESGNTYYVSHIYYGGKDRAGCYGHVSFEYSDVSGFPASYVAGVEIKPGKILKKIVSSVKVNGAETELMHYDLTHSGDSWHFLTKISAGCGTETLNPLSFDYGYSGMDEDVLQLFSDKYLQTETTFTYHNNATASRYHVGLPLTKSVKRTRGGDQWTDKETYTYDAAGRPLTRVLHTGTSGTVKKEETRWTYDAWGNVLSEMSSPYGSGVFTGTTYAYDSSGRYLTEATGALVGTMIPSYSAFNGSQFANGMAEIGYNTMRGAVTGLASGFVDSSLYGNPGLIWQNAVGGAISGGSRSILMNAIFGAPYKPEEIDYKADGLFRGGGLADLISGTGNGVTIGRNLYTNSEITSNETYDGVRFHETRHLLQQNELGFAKFYGEILKEYIMEVYGSGKLETDAHNYMLEEIGKHNY